MKKYIPMLLVSVLIMTTPRMYSQYVSWPPQLTPAGKKTVNTRVDNMAYWVQMVRLGYAVPNPYVVVEDPVYKTSMIYVPGIPPQNSPDVPVASETGNTQSENSIFADPSSQEVVLNSNNSTDWSGASAGQLFGADDLYSIDTAASWGGTIEGAGGTNSGDPATAISLNGRWYIGKISNPFGQNVAWSDDQGLTWTDVVAGPPPGGYPNLLDKNHLWIDNSVSSPFEGHLYDAWTAFVSGTSRDGQIEFSRSVNQGLSWSPPMIISAGLTTGGFNHGVNIHTGPNGEIYAAWAIYDSWPSDESAIGFAMSLDGGVTFTPPSRVIDNIKGIRTTGVSKALRVNSFPCMTVDLSNGPNSGNIYVVWANIGVPGVNTGTDVDVYLIRSSDQGATWTAPVRINQDPSGLGKKHFFPWITCDPLTGNLCVVYYDDRQVSSAKLETWISYSYDGGLGWTDLQVSDVAFTPAPIPGLAASYFGDYLGITSSNMKIYPVWTDNRSGHAMGYVSPLDLGPPPNQPYVMFYSYDLASIPSKGKQTLNFGDSLYLSLGLKNIGDQPANSLNAILSADSPYITVTDSTEGYGNMAAGEVKIVPDGYSIKVSDTIPDDLKVRFTVKITDSDTTWISRFTVEAHAPNMAVTRMVIHDSAGGNDNGLLDAGETADILITTKNTGDFPCILTYGLLSSTSEAITLNTDSTYLDTLLPGQSKISTFNVTVGDDVTQGTGIQLSFQAHSGLYQALATYQETIGLIVEDWETHTFTKFPWQFSGDKQWVLTNADPYEGLYCSESGWIYDNQMTTLFVNYTSSVDDSIAFHLKTSTEDGFDFLNFYIDDVMQQGWSGETPWKRVAFPVTAGTHTYKWIYIKDIYVSGGSDRTWIDFIEFPPPILPLVNAGADDTICAGTVYQLSGSAALYDSVAWITHGDGTFDTLNILHPVYTPGTNDILNGKVKLTLKGYAQYGSSGNSLDLTIGNIPVVSVSVEPKDTLCQWQSATLTANTEQNGVYQWTPGSFSTQAITVDTAVTGGLGTIQFRVMFTNQYGCASSDSSTITFRDCTAIEEHPVGFSYSVLPNPGKGAFSLDLYAPAPEQVTIRLYSSNRALVFEEKQVEVRSKTAKVLHLDGLAAGMYILEIERASGTLTDKLIISR
jgi:hypothetical protein